MRNFSIDIETRAHTDLSPQQAEEIDELLHLAFPQEPDYGYEWAEPALHLTAREEGRLVGHVGLLEREVLVGGQAVRVGGVGNVATHPDWQGNGIARLLVRAATEIHRKNGCRFAMLFCDEKLAGYYERCGYARLEGALFIRSRDRRMQIHEVKMAMALDGNPGLRLRPAVKKDGSSFSPLAGWPQGEIDLQGLPW